jgi:hypothetical protein
LDLVNILASSLVVFNPQDQKKKRKIPIFEKDQNLSPVESNFIEELKKSAGRVLKDS